MSDSYNFKLKLIEMRDSSLNVNNNDSFNKTSSLKIDQCQIDESLNKNVIISQNEKIDGFENKKSSEMNSCNHSPANLHILQFSNNYEGIYYLHHFRKKRNYI